MYEKLKSLFQEMIHLKFWRRLFLAIQWLRLGASSASGSDAISGPEIKIPKAAGHRQKLKQKSK